MDCWWKLFDAELEFPGIAPNELARSRQGVSIQFKPGNANQAVGHIFINTSNGSYDEIIDMEEVGDTWEYDARLFRGTQKQPLRVFSSSGFPKERLKPATTQ